MDKGYRCDEGYKTRRDGMYWEHVVGQPASAKGQG